MPAGIYLHIPFCKSRCSYCDFATDVWRGGEVVERYVDALCAEIQGGNTTGRECVSSSRLKEDTHPTGRVSAFIDTIYLGGGTPSLLLPVQVERILKAVRDHFDLASDIEITLEMNPATVTPEMLAEFKSLGINRASFGVQTFSDHDLKLLARGHNADDARQTFRLLRETGFENVSFDLIIGLPGQTINDWEKNLDEALSMQPEHLSLYLLEIHQGTPLAEQIRSERRPMPDEELAAEMYELMLDKTSAGGFAQYEISNFSRPGFESRHNTKYWRLDPIYGFGVSAHSFDGAQRYANERDTAKYVKLIEEFGAAEVMRERIDLASEFVFLGLRLNKGIDLKEYRERFGEDVLDKYRSGLARLKEEGLIEVTSECMSLTRKGMLFSNEVFAEFV